MLQPRRLELTPPTRQELTGLRYSRLKQAYRRFKYRGSQFLEKPRRRISTWATRNGIRPPGYQPTPRPFRPARAPSTKKKTRKTTDEDSFNDVPGGGESYEDEPRPARWDE